MSIKNVIIAITAVVGMMVLAIAGLIYYIALSTGFLEMYWGSEKVFSATTYEELLIGERQLRKSIERNPLMAASYYPLAYAEMMSYRSKDACKTVERLLEFDSSDYNKSYAATIYREYYRSQYEFDKALEKSREGLQYEIQDVWSYLDIVDDFLALDQFDSVVIYLNKLNDTFSDSLTVLNQLGECFESVGAHDEALKYYRKSFDLGNRDAAISIAWFHILNTEFDKAEEYLNMENDDLYTTNWVKSLLYQRKNELDKAQEMADRVYKMMPIAPASQVLFASIQCKRGNLDSARVYLRKAEKVDSLDPNYLYQSACVEALDGNNDRAFSYLQKAVDGGYYDLNFILNDEEMKSLHDDPRFQEIKVQLEMKQNEWKKAVEEHLNI